MRPFEVLATFEEVTAIAQRIAAPLQRYETVSLLHASDRVLAADAVAQIDVPGDDRAAMDGYAVRASDAQPGAVLQQIGRIAAGQPANGRIELGACIEIATGASIPEGGEAVIPVEQTEREGTRVSVLAGVGGGEHIARRGIDLQVGGTIGSVDDLLNPALLSACAAGGVAEVQVVVEPRVLIAPTGDEVVPIGKPLGRGQVYDSNAAGLAALLGRCGARVERAEILGDDTAAVTELLARPGFDLVVTIGGTSVGRRDLVPDALAEAGEILLHGAALRPGKPLLLATADGRPFVGLPGFPTTCMMLGYAVLAPMVRRMGRRPETVALREAELAESVRSPVDKTQFLPVALRQGRAVPTFTFSSAISSMANAVGWIQIPAGVSELEAGSPVQISLF